jgi:hypothetical protein
VATTEQCLEQLDGVFHAAHDPSGAYLIRSRLRRTLLSCARLVAASTGAPKPDAPGVFRSATGANAHELEILRLCERIYSIAGDLCQPSESFDTRWEHGWAGLREELGRLRELLRGWPTAPAT